MIVLKNRIEELRKEKGIKQEDLAIAVEVSRQTIGSLENGRYNPSIILAFKIARYFHMSIDYIIHHILNLGAPYFNRACDLQLVDEPITIMVIWLRLVAQFLALLPYLGR